MPGKVLVTADHYLPGGRAGGPIASLAGILNEDRGSVDTTLVTGDRDLGDREPYISVPIGRPTRVGRVVVWYVAAKPWPVFRALRRAGASDVIYMNSLFSPFFTLWPLLLLRLGLIRTRMIAIAPRGELSPDALQLKRWKKRIATPLLRHVLTSSDTAWHASNEREAEQITAFLGRTPTRLLVEADPPPSPQEPSRPSPSPTLRVLFVARIAPIKNLTSVLSAVKIYPGPVQLTIVGAVDDVAYWRKCEEIIASLPQTCSVNIRGHVPSQEVFDWMHRSDVLLLPTLSENFGHAIAQSLSVGLPVVIPDTTPWTELVMRGCGHIIDAQDATAQAAALYRIHSASAMTRHSLRQNTARIYRQWWQEHQKESRPVLTQLLLLLERPPASPRRRTYDARP